MKRINKKNGDSPRREQSVRGEAGRDGNAAMRDLMRALGFILLGMLCYLLVSRTLTKRGGTAQPMCRSCPLQGSCRSGEEDACRFK